MMTRPPTEADLRRFVRDIATLKASPAGEAICESAARQMLDTLIKEAASMLRAPVTPTPPPCGRRLPK
jgi:hypothetical protein